MKQNTLLKNMLLSLLCLLMALPLLGLAEALDGQSVVNPGKPLMLYAEPGGKKPLQRQLFTMEDCQLVQAEGDWALVEVNNEAGESLTAYVKAKTLRPLSENEGSTAAWLTGEGPVDLLKSKSSKGTVLSRYAPGVKVQVLEAADRGFVKVRLGTLIGYVKEGALSQAAPDKAAALQEGSVLNPKGHGLNLRAEPSYQADTIATVPNSQTVRVLGIGKEFAHVLTENHQVGFLMASGLSPQPLFDKAALEAPSNLPQPEGDLLTIKNQEGQGATLRAKKSTSSASLGMYPNGSQVVLLKWGEYWLRVWVDGREGYMMTKFFDVQQAKPPEVISDYIEGISPFPGSDTSPTDTAPGGQAPVGAP